MQILAIGGPYPTAPVNAPTSLSAIPTNTSVAISFTAPTNNGGTPITNYEYSFNGSSWTALSPADATSPVTVSGLTQNTGYTVYLRAVNIVGSGPASTGVSFTTEGVPTGTPTITSIPINTTTATVNFTYPGGGGAVTGYELYVANQTNAWNNTTASPISVTGLSPNTTYTFYVRAKNAYGVGPQSVGVNATTLKAAPSTVEAQVLSGGGGGGQAVGGGGNGGGGGGGGYTVANASVGTGIAYTITVGAGVARATNGSPSSAALGSTVSSNAGALGVNANGNVGGAGGAGGSGSTANGGTGGTGGTGGGNGGAGGNGGTGTGGGAGGAGASSGTGGNGAANTGGGGGGGGYSAGLGGSGGSGKVIIRYSNSFRVAASTTGSPTLDTSGGYNTYTFTGSGSITF